MPQPKKYANEAEKKAAYRARRRQREQQETLEALDAIAEAAMTFGLPAASGTARDVSELADETASEIERIFTADEPPEQTESAGRGFLTEREYMAQVAGMVSRGGSIAHDFSNRR